MKLEEKLVSLRKGKGLSQLKLAELLDVSRQAISRWETGISAPSVENMRYLANLYDVSLEYLLNDDADEPDRNKDITTSENLGENEESSTKKEENGKSVATRWIAIILCILVLVVAVCICVSVKDEGDFVPINNTQKKGVESEKCSGFDLEW